MLDKDVFKVNMENLMHLFKSWNFDPSNASEAKAWYSMFRNFDNNRFEHMVSEYINNERFPPTVAGLKAWDTAPKKSIDQLRHEQYMSKHNEQIRREKNA